MRQICEDIPQVLDSDVPGLPERPIGIFLPRLYKVSLYPVSIFNVTSAELNLLLFCTSVCNRAF